MLEFHHPSSLVSKPRCAQGVADRTQRIDLTALDISLWIPCMRQQVVDRVASTLECFFRGTPAFRRAAVEMFREVSEELRDRGGTSKGNGKETGKQGRVVTRKGKRKILQGEPKQLPPASQLVTLTQSQISENTNQIYRTGYFQHNEGSTCRRRNNPRTIQESIGFPHPARAFHSFASASLMSKYLRRPAIVTSSRPHFAHASE